VRNDVLSALELSSRGPKDVIVCSALQRDGIGAILDAALRITETDLAARREERLRERLDAAVARRLADLRKSPAASRALDAELAKLSQGGGSFHDAIARIVTAAAAAGSGARP
jgi:hypothetical protein